MKCVSCGEPMKAARENYRYDESGLSNVTLQNIEVRRCPACGEFEAVIPHIEELHAALAVAVARKTGKLAPQEVRYLRSYLGFSGADFAEVIGTTPETVSRWENGRTPMGPVAERALRLMVFTRNPVETYPLEELKHVAVGEAKPARVRALRDRKSWRAEAKAA